jgi:hypothetical protein
LRVENRVRRRVLTPAAGVLLAPPTAKAAAGKVIRSSSTRWDTTNPSGWIGKGIPWTGGFYLQWTPNTELFEYVCQENNFASTLLVGGGSQESVDRPSQIVP